MTNSILIALWKPIRTFDRPPRGDLGQYPARTRPPGGGTPLLYEIVQTGSCRDSRKGQRSHAQGAEDKERAWLHVGVERGLEATAPPALSIPPTQSRVSMVAHDPLGDFFIEQPLAASPLHTAFELAVANRVPIRDFPCKTCKILGCQFCEGESGAEKNCYRPGLS